MAEDNTRYAMVCNCCGSGEVSRDAWANWDMGKQEWVLGSTFDAAFCHKCDSETSIIEVELAPTSS